MLFRVVQKLSWASLAEGQYKYDVWNMPYLYGIEYEASNKPEGHRFPLTVWKQNNKWQNTKHSSTKLNKRLHSGGLIL